MSALPTKKAVPVFAFTRHGMVIPLAVATDNSDDFFVGELVRLVSGSHKDEGYFQDETLVLIAEKTPVDYTDASTLQYLGIVTQDEPINHMLFQDQNKDLELEDRSMNLDTLAGPMKNLSVLVGMDISLVRLWDVVNDEAASIDDDNIWDTVYVSKTDGGEGHTGKEGYGTVVDQSSVAGIVEIGKVVGVPVQDSFWAYVLHNPEGAR